MATRAVARRKSATGETADAASSVRVHGGEIADRDLVGMYLDEIARTPLLDAAKEVELSQIIEAGVFARQVLDGFEESKADATREELEALVAAGERAKDVFIRSNLRLVVAVARRYPRSGLPLLDLIQEATPAWCARSRSSTTARASSSRRTPPGGSARRSRAR